MEKMKIYIPYHMIQNADSKTYNDLAKNAKRIIADDIKKQMVFVY